MAVYNDGYDNEEEHRADLAWEYRKGGPNDPNLYEEEEPEEDAEEEEEVRLIDAEALKKALDEQMNFEENCLDSVFDIIDNAPTVDKVINVYPAGEVIVQEKRPQDALQYSAGYQDGYLEAKKLYESPHAEWRIVNPYEPDYKKGKLVCTHCSQQFNYADFCNIAPLKCFPNFCPNCGADMLEEGGT